MAAVAAAFSSSAPSGPAAGASWGLGACSELLWLSLLPDAALGVVVLLLLVVLMSGVVVFETASVVVAGSAAWGVDGGLGSAAAQGQTQVVVGGATCSGYSPTKVD